MTELEALRRVAEAASAVFARLDLSSNTPWELHALRAALDELPANATKPVGEVVACYVSRNDGSATWVLAGSMADTLSARSENWRRVGEMRVPLPRVPEVVGEVVG